MSFLLDQTLKRISKNSPPLIMTHVVLGYPSLQASCELALSMIDGGASIVELQIPFSDPLADGPTIMRANEHALTQGVTPHKCMRAMEWISKRTDAPILFMSYYNLLYNYNKRKNGAVAEFLKDASNAGAEGMIVPDIPIEEDINEKYWTLAKQHNLSAIPLVSPLTPSARLLKLGKLSDSFVYCVSTTGTTGSRTSLPADLNQYLKRVRSQTKVPRAVGFGISSPAHIRALKGHAEIAVIGSATIDLISRTNRNHQSIVVQKFIKSLCRH